MHLEELGMIVHVFVRAGGAQPPQVTGWELALVSDVNRAESVSAPSNRVEYFSKICISFFSFFLYSGIKWRVRYPIARKLSYFLFYFFI